MRFRIIIEGTAPSKGAVRHFKKVHLSWPCPIYDVKVKKMPIEFVREAKK